MAARCLLSITATFLFFSQVLAKEGMWLPVLLEKYNIEEMQQMGFRLSAQDIYDVNHASMKDAVVLFGGGCTGELISGEGLLITNHHCGYRQIQMHSSVDNDVLTHGFWAMNRGEELPNPGLSVSFLERMEDVTDQVLDTTHDMSGEEERSRKIMDNITAIEKRESKDGKYRAIIRPLFYGNQYFLHLYKVYTDVRLVGAPPSAIGKFGGDTDNWMWPRHTGDFALFRIYAGQDNEPAEYSKENVPYIPKRFFPISLRGIEPEDFTMVLGYPGRTTQYLTSHAVDLIMKQRNPDRIAIRDRKLEVMGEFMAKDAQVRIQYASKYAGVSNSWKKWQGENGGLVRMDVVGIKREFERSFEAWSRSNGTWESLYGPLMENFQSQYQQFAPYAKASDYYNEIVINGIEIFTIAGYMDGLIRQVERTGEISDHVVEAGTILLDRFFKDYHQPLDEKMFSSLLPLLTKDLPKQYLPGELVENLERYQGTRLAVKLYRKSILVNRERLAAVLASGSVQKLKQIEKDPGYKLYKALRNFYDLHIFPVSRMMEDGIDAGMKTYMAGILQESDGRPFYPDANSTLRISYGRVEGYKPYDGVIYRYYTTLEGKIEKDNPEIYDYDVPSGLKELYKSRDYGAYGHNGKLPVCFIASNHTTGGNSGSPVLNADGHLVGINFDRCWEGTMSDIMYDPDICRNIALDMRYALFIIDKFAGAGYLIKEMELVW